MMTNLPVDILNKNIKIIEKICPPNIQKSTVVLLQYCLPPPSEYYISKCVEYINTLSPIDFPIDSDILDELKYYWSEVTSKTEIKLQNNIATEFPLYNSIRLMAENNKTRNNKHLVSPTAISFHLKLCLSALSGNKVSKNVYYTDVLGSRNIIIHGLSILGISPDNYNSLKELSNLLSDEINRFSSKANIINNTDFNYWTNRFERLKLLIDGTKKFGHTERISNEKRVQKCSTLIKVKHSPNSNTKIEHDIVSSDEYSDTLTLPDGGGFIHSRETDENSDQTYKCITRDTGENGSRLTPRDDRYALQYRIAAMSAKNVVSFSDIHRLPRPTIIRFFSFLADLNATQTLTIVWLTLNYGINQKRLENLCFSTYSELKKSTNHMKLLLTDDLLIYFVNNGATDFKRKQTGQSSDSMFMKSLIPEVIATELRGIISDNSMDHELENADKLARKYSRYFPGPTPTLERIAASYWTLISPHMGDEIEAAYVTGNIPARHRAQTNYYQLDREKINIQLNRAQNIFQLQLHKSNHSSDKLKYFVNRLHFSKNIPDGTIGSQIALPINSLHNLFSEINLKFKTYRENTYSIHPDDRLQDIVILLQLQHLQLYVIQSIALGLRPIGSVAEVSVSGENHGCCVKDKGSNLYHERGLAVLVKQYEVALNTMRIDLSSFMKYAETLNIDMKYENEDRLPTLALNITVSTVTDKENISVIRMRGSMFSKLLETYGLLEHFPFKNNFTRHCIATITRQLLPESIRDEYLHHERAGLDFCSPWSTSNGTSFQSVKKVIEEILKELPIHKLSVGELL